MNTYTNSITGIFFSKDRAMQLDAALRSFLLHCEDDRAINLKVLYKTSDKFHESQYQTLIQDYDQIEFIREQDFRKDLLSHLQPFQHVLFLVDDNIFIRHFNVSNIVELLRQNPDSLGYSLRLGRNNTYFYIGNRKQNLPVFKEISTNVLKFNWTVSEHDFGFPLEVSSSVYRLSDLWMILSRFDFSGPNSLEALLSDHKNIYSGISPYLLCHDLSVTFCNPVNIVNTECICRSGSRSDYSCSSLAELFDKGLRIDVASYENFTPDSCHQEVDLFFRNHKTNQRISLDRQADKQSVHETWDSDRPMEPCGQEDLLSKGRSLFENSHPREAEKVFRVFLENNPHSAEAYNDLACVLWQMNRLPEALRELNNAMAIEPDNRDAVWNLGQIFITMDRGQDACHVYQSYVKEHPEDIEIAKALSDIKNNIREYPEASLSGVSVIIPAFNCEKTIIRSLESIKDSLESCKKSIGLPYFDVIIVDDNSTDNTYQVSAGFTGSFPGFYLIRNKFNRGAGYSRNKGVKHAKGDLIFFLDGDDIFFKDHISLCVRTMQENPLAQFLQTRICLDDKIHPYWKAAIEDSVPFNLCVRRWCHDLLGGYPEDNHLRTFGGEDIIYRYLLDSFFIGIKIEKETIHHFRYPGNSLDRQMDKFSRAPDDNDEPLENERLMSSEFHKIKDLHYNKLSRLFGFWHEQVSLRMKNR